MADFFKDFVVADARTCKANWRGLPPGKGFFCAFCGTPFKVGDEYRAIYTNDMPGSSGNPLCCRQCFHEQGGVEGLRPAWKALCEEYETRFKWWAVVAQHAE